MFTALDPQNKLFFYRDRSDEEYETARKIFLKAVCCKYLVILLVLLTDYHTKLQSHIASNNPAPAQPAQPIQIPKTSQPTAKEILGLRRTRTAAGTAGSQATSLEMEVDQYLSDPNEGTGIILEYWQVHFFSFHSMLHPLA
jgi:hypothetical protein